MISATFGAYVLSIFVFGAVYYLLYRQRPYNFFFASEINKWQAQTAIESIEKELIVLTRELEAMQEVRTATISNGFTGGKTVLPSGHFAETETYVVHNQQYTESQDRLRLKVWDVDGTSLCSVEGPQDETLTQAYLTSWLDRMLVQWQTASERGLDRLQRIKSDPQESWRLLDFVYFSTITQTTVGYGDILPNSSSVRVAVVVQILLGYFLLVTFLNIILSAPIA
jgi:hypothetical protein